VVVVQLGEHISLVVSEAVDEPASLDPGQRSKRAVADLRANEVQEFGRDRVTVAERPLNLVPDERTRPSLPAPRQLQVPPLVVAPCAAAQGHG
jgi:hypothetical protein